MALATDILTRRTSMQLIRTIREGTRAVETGTATPFTKEVLAGAWAELKKRDAATWKALKGCQRAGIPFYQKDC